MSRTYHHRPLAVRFRDVTEPGLTFNHDHRFAHDDGSYCDLDAWLADPSGGLRSHSGCDTSLRTVAYTTPPPRWFRAHRWWNPERVRERDHLRRAAQAYNAGELDDDLADFANHQHHHGAWWEWS